jgi:Fe-S-cluster containining protein
MKFKEYQALAIKIADLFNEMDQQNNQFANSSNLSCSTTCGGICCKSNTVEVSPIDLIPLVIEIITNNEQDKILPKLYLNHNNHCVLWHEGKCSIYKNRPVLCRLFGVSAIFNKKDETTLSICSYIKKENETDIIKNIEMAPNIVTYAAKVNNLLPEWDSTAKPINQSLIYAIERILNSYYWENY